MSHLRKLALNPWPWVVPAAEIAEYHFGTQQSGLGEAQTALGKRVEDVGGQVNNPEISGIGKDLQSRGSNHSLAGEALLGAANRPITTWAIGAPLRSALSRIPTQFGFSAFRSAIPTNPFSRASTLNPALLLRGAGAGLATAGANLLDKTIGGYGGPQYELGSGSALEDATQGVRMSVAGAAGGTPLGAWGAISGAITNPASKLVDLAQETSQIKKDTAFWDNYNSPAEFAKRRDGRLGEIAGDQGTRAALLAGAGLLGATAIGRMLWNWRQRKKQENSAMRTTAFVPKTADAIVDASAPIAANKLNGILRRKVGQWVWQPDSALGNPGNTVAPRPPAAAPAPMPAPAPKPQQPAAASATQQASQPAAQPIKPTAPTTAPSAGGVAPQAVGAPTAMSGLGLAQPAAQPAAPAHKQAARGNPPPNAMSPDILPGETQEDFALRQQENATINSPENSAARRSSARTSLNEYFGRIFGGPLSVPSAPAPAPAPAPKINSPALAATTARPMPSAGPAASPKSPAPISTPKTPIQPRVAPRAVPPVQPPQLSPAPAKQVAAVAPAPTPAPTPAGPSLGMPKMRATPPGLRPEPTALPFNNFMASFRKTHGTAFDPKSKMDQWKMTQLQTGNRNVSSKDYVASSVAPAPATGSPTPQAIKPPTPPSLGLAQPPTQMKGARLLAWV